MKKLSIEWKYFAKEGKTCERCSATRKNIHAAINNLRKELQMKNIDLELRETILPINKIADSNIILIDGVPIEKILSNSVRGESECCSCGDLCGKPTDCRTVNINGLIYEEIPVSLIKQAILKKLKKG